MSGRSLKRARLKAGLSQLEAAKALGVSQSLLSRMEAGQRQVTQAVSELALRLWPVPPEELPLTGQRSSSDEQLAADLGALGYPGFRYLHGTVRNPAELLFDALDRADLDARVLEGLPWLVLQFPEMDWEWLVLNAKLHNLQNRLGYLLNLAAKVALRLQPQQAASFYGWLSALFEARLAKTDTLCQESWPPSQRRHAHLKRTKLAAFWNLDTRLTENDLAFLSA